MRPTLALVSAVLLSACAPALPALPAVVPEVTAVALCADLEGFGGREVWLTTMIDPTSLVVYRATVDEVCEPSARPPAGTLECCQSAMYVFGFVCAGVGVVLVPSSLTGDPSELDVRLVRDSLTCAATSDGAPGGGTCRPDDCATRHPAPSTNDVVALRGTLAVAPYDGTDPNVLSDPTLPPILLFAVRELRFGELPDAGPDSGLCPTRDACCGMSAGDPCCADGLCHHPLRCDHSTWPRVCLARDDAASADAGP